METTSRNTYTNTDKTRILNFVQCLQPTSEEQPYLARILAKSSYSNRDLKMLFELVARRASETPLQGDAIAALGLPALPVHAPSAARCAPAEAIA